MRNQILVNEKIIVTPEFKRKKKVYKFNFFVSVFLVCSLFSCYIYAEYDRNKSEQVSQEILLGLQESDDTAENNNTTSSISVEEDTLVVKLSNVEEVQEDDEIVNVSELIVDQDIPTQTSMVVESVSKDGVSYYTESILRIPSLSIEYPVLSDTSDELLKISLNKLWGPNPNQVGNYVIMGHNYKSGKMFGKLSEISIGDTFEVEDLSGRSLTYQVYDKYIVEPTDVRCTSQLTDGKKEVTLITCHNSGKQRLIVKAEEVSTKIN